MGGSIDADCGVVANIVAPPSNYPRASYTSTISPAYSGGTVYHYFAVIGYWCSLDQLASLIPPKGYAYPAGAVARDVTEGLFMSLPTERQEDLARKIDEIHHELTHRFESHHQHPGAGEEPPYTETLVEYVLEVDKKLEEMNTLRLPALQKALETVTGLFKKRT